MEKATNLETALKHKDTITELRLTDDLEYFPIEILSLKNLEKLDVSCSEITKIPKEIGSLSTLKILDLSYNEELTDFPIELGKLQNLEVLELDNCNLTKIPDFVFKLKKLKVLQCSYNEIIEIPKEIGDLQNLEKLRMSKNALIKIPSELFNIKSLKSIRLWENNIESIPNSIGNLSTLEELIIRENKLTEIPTSIHFCENLKNLNLEENLIDQIPNEIGQCVNLENIRLGKNQLKNIPNSIGNLSKLETLDLSNNRITEINECIQSLKLLEVFLVNNNQLQKLPETIGNLSNLSNLDFSYNQLKDLPDIFTNLSQLNKLNLQYNQLVRLPESMKSLTNLWNANIEGNKFVEGGIIPVLYWNAGHNIQMRDTELFHILHRYEYRDFFKAIKKAESSHEYRGSFYQLLKKKYTNTLIPIRHLIEAVNIKFKHLQNHALDYIKEFYSPKLRENPLQEGSEIVILGKVSFNKNEVKKRLKDHGLTTALKIKKTTTHVVLGKEIAKFEGIEQEGLTFLTDISLNDFLEKKEDTYLKGADDSLKSDVKEMLLSKSEDTIALALEMLKQGGVDQDYITALFLIFKNPALNKKSRNIAKNFLQIHASESLKAQLSSRSVIFKDGINEDTLSWNIKSYFKNEEENYIDTKLVGQYISEWTGNGYRYWFSQLTENETLEIINQQIRDNPKFVLRRSYFFDTKILLQCTSARNVSFGESYLNNVPEELRNFKELRSLNLSESRIKELPNWFSELTNLETLYISENNIKEFPEVLTNMPNLKTIGTYKCPFMNDRENIPNCFIASYYNLTRK